MKKSILIIVYIVLAVAIIWGGVWYSGKISEETQNQAASAGVAAEQAQTQVMQNLKITDDVVGTGAVAETGDSVTVNYVGTLDNGTKFDSSYDRKQPFTFTLGVGQVIKGWDEGVLGMKVGGKRELVIPSELGYGAQAFGPIPASSTLHFTVELLAVGTSTSK